LLSLFTFFLPEMRGDKPIASEMIIHPLSPVFAADSQVLILGTMPSPKSRESGFYYGHPQNRFWRVLAAVLQQPVPGSIPAKKELLLQNQIALWDVLHSCSICGADDSSIREPKPNDISALLRKTKIHAVFTTGRKAFLLYEKLVFPTVKIPAVCLPSTSPANCRYSIEELITAYYSIAKELQTGGKIED
jgi:hypoxanthine-DNA glycosylase